jgi:hypothetical protein
LPTNSVDRSTVGNIKDLQYYVSDYNRFTNLPNGPLAATQTFRFYGFLADGTVQTTIVAKPSADPVPPEPAPYYDPNFSGGTF